jgi:hypothetical protein
MPRARRARAAEKISPEYTARNVEAERASGRACFSPPAPPAAAFFSAAAARSRRN